MFGSKRDRLIKQFKANKADDRRGVCFHLREFQDDEVTVLLCEALGDADDEVRLAALRSVSTRHGERVTAAIVKFIKQFGFSGDAGKIAVDTLAASVVSTASMTAVEGLTLSVKDWHEDIYDAASNCLVNFAKTAPTPLYLQLLNVLLASENIGSTVDRRVQDRLMRLLDKIIGQRPSPEAAKPLLAAFRMASLVVRKHLALAADKCGWKPQNAEQRATFYVATNRLKEAEVEGEAALKPLMWTLKNLLRSNSSLASTSDCSLARELIQCLGRMKDRRTVPFLLERLGECKERWDYPWEIVDALAAIGDDRLVAPCVEMLRDRQRGSSVRSAIARALGRFGLSQSNPARIVEALRALAAEPDPVLAEVSLEALADFGDAAALENLLKHDHPKQRRKALVVLHRQANEQRLLEVARDHSSIMTRAEACQFLSNDGLKSLADADSTIGKVALALLSLWSNSIGMGFRVLPDPEYPISVGIFSVTNEQYRCFDSDHDSSLMFPGCSLERSKVDKGIINAPDFPAVCVPLERAEAFCKWLTAKEGRVYRLPTVKEWKRACVTDIKRWWFALEEGTLNTLFRWDILSMGVAPRGFAQSYPNPWGLHAMLGNVQEWISGTVESRPWTAAEFSRRGIVGPGVQEAISRGPQRCWQVAGCSWHAPGDLFNAPPWLTPFTMERQHGAMEDGVGFRVVCE